MNSFIGFLKSQFSRSNTSVLFGIGITLLIIAVIIGVSDNPPGIGLTYLGLAFICFSLVHHWRTARQFGTLLAVSVISFPVMVLVHNIFYAINVQVGTIPVLNQLLSGLGVIFFLGGVLVAPAVVLVAILGGLYYLIFKHTPD